MTTIGPFPIVTETTITEPGWYWFEPGCPDAGSRASFVNIDRGILEDKHQLNCRKWRGRYAGPFMPPSMACQHRGDAVRYEQFHNVHKCNLCGMEFKVVD